VTFCEIRHGVYLSTYRENNILFINTIMRTQTLKLLYAFIVFVWCMECVLFIIGIRQI
jgi:hypothetical protein